MKIKNNALLIILNILVFAFFLGFIYFSYFTAKVLLVLKYIDSKDYAAKFYSWELQEGNNPYSYKHRNYFSDEVKFDKKLSFQEKSNKIAENNRKVIKDCNDRLNQKSEIKKNADFKYNFIKYGLATLFFLILFLVFAAQNITFYNKKK